MPHTELELIATEDLIGELYARYDCCVFAGLRNLGASDQETDCGFAGGAVTARGLTGDLLDYIKAHPKVHKEQDHLGDWEDEL
jgi:hypothetical protein